MSTQYKRVVDVEETSSGEGGTVEKYYDDTDGDYNNENVADDSLLTDQALEDAEPMKRVIIITTTMFMGYAILVSFQKKLKDVYGIPDGNSPESKEFAFAVSFLYLGNLIFRLAHNFVFGFTIPRNRVYIALGCMILSMGILYTFVYTLRMTNSLVWVYLAYILGGVGIGSFESNLLSAITPLGHKTKMWAILGFPLGFMLITVGGFFMTSIGVTTSAIYFFVLVCNILSLFMFYFTIPVTTMKHNGQSFGDFIQSMKVITTWGPAITWHSTALMVNMFFVSMNSVMLYIYNDAKVVPLWGSNSDVLVNHDDYFVFFNLALMLGDSFSRKLVYWYYTSDKPLPNPWYWLVFSVLGAGICFLKLAFIAPLGAFFVMFANGGIYAISTKHIDRNVLKEFNLVALSVWLFVGDIGSFTGSNMIPYIQDIVCSKHFEYVCEQN